MDLGETVGKFCFLQRSPTNSCSSGRAKTAHAAYVVQRAGRNATARRLFAAPAPARWTLEHSLATPPIPSSPFLPAIVPALPRPIPTPPRLPPSPSSHRRPSRATVLRRTAPGRSPPLWRPQGVRQNARKVCIASNFNFFA